MGKFLIFIYKNNNIESELRFTNIFGIWIRNGVLGSPSKITIPVKKLQLQLNISIVTQKQASARVIEYCFYVLNRKIRQNVVSSSKLHHYVIQS